MVSNYLPNYFGGYSGIANIGIASNKLYDVTVSTTGVSGMTVKINSITPNTSGSWTGKYYSAVPVTVKASAPPSGYEFDGWTVTNGTAASSSSLTTTVTITGNAQIIAKYKQTGSDIIPATGINLSVTNISNLKIGETRTITATVTPTNTTYKTVIWVSDNPAVASVSNGKVTAIDGGTATITASTIEGTHKATCTVTVKPPVVLLDLAARLQTLNTQVIDSWDKFNTAFGGLPISSGGSIDFYYNNDLGQTIREVTYEIVNDGGVKKLKVNDFVKWAPGLDIKNDITFKTGDIIEVKGKYLNGPSNGITINKDAWGWDPLQNWNQWCNDGEVFQQTFTLTATDASSINSYGEIRDGTAFKLKTGGIDPWSGYVSSGVGSYLIEQLKIYRIE